MFTSLLKQPFSLLLLFLLLFTPPPSLSLSFSSHHYRTLLSISHSLSYGVANLRASSCDFEGSARAQSIAQKIKSLQGLHFSKLTDNLGWDSLKNYAWRDMSLTKLASTVSDVNELLRVVNELSRAPRSLSLSFSIYDYRTLLSISHSLSYGVADLRASRGDFEGSARAQSIAQKIEFLQGLDSWKLTYDLGWDSLKNYHYRTTTALSFSIYHYRTLLSISHSLAYRVANLRASRGDFEGSARAQSIAQMIEFLQGLDSWKLTYNLAWDSLKNYAWREMSFTNLASAVSDVNELLRALNELSRVDSDTERVSWVGGNYNRIFAVFRSLFDKHLKGPLREVVETMQKELVEGDFLRDCRELGTNDLKGLIQVLKDITLTVQNVYI